ncbi:hypothetical protein SAMN05216201_11122 [Pseudomonas linyingensis]|uniref:Phage-related protein n=1 Tax=Pseudomonas linyingensis TaxID=915471 RepID=A0A1H7A755_9PSED|nr:hypothetical protein [Pseudomonas linyingensis]SEJ56875.1 hypothetical protein SAMN05216201_11122 [Pseudomonas linyingensis]
MPTENQPAPRERPILFSGPMVRAILEGRKTVTRRPVKDGQIPTEDKSIPAEGPRWSAIGQRHPRYGFCVFGETEAECAQALAEHGRCPYGQLGDRLWVRETFTDLRGTGVEHRPAPTSPLQRYAYAADCPSGSYADSTRKDFGLKWRPSIHMPRAASRILLEITAVRVERLQDGEGETTFESRYLAEGINRIHHGDGEYYYHAFESEPGPSNWIDPFDAWRELWTSVNGSTSWAANPWVWVVEFKVVTP